MDANQPASPRSPANEQPWENVTGVGPRGIIISEGGAQKGPRETRRVQDPEDVCGNLGRSLPVGAGWWEWRGLTRS